MFRTVRSCVKIIGTVNQFSQKVAQPLPIKKPKASGSSLQNFIDCKQLRVIGGKGGDGCISFLQLWSNEHAGPDGGDGGNGGHVIFQATSDLRDLYSVPTVIKADDGDNGANKDCNGKNAGHYMVKVPIGTVIKNDQGTVVGDLTKEGLMFIAARGGAGGKGNHFFISDTEQAPKICEYGATGETFDYTIEIRSMANAGLIGFPNAGKSTLLRAISRARPKVAPYPFTTIKPSLGIVEYEDYEQVAVADLPGLIPDSHKNKGLGIQFLKHAERCMVLLYVLDASLDEPWNYLEMLQFELSQFNAKLCERPQLVVANKIDLPDAKQNLEALREKTNIPVIPLSAKTGENVTRLLREIKIIYDKQKDEALKVDT